MSLFDSLYAVGAVRRTLWRLWYPFLTRRLRREDVLLLNYAFETEPPLGLPLSTEDELNRACIQLYHHVASQGNIAGKRVLEISCGHGGGASYLMRTLRPAEYVALDFNPQGIQFCRERHATVSGLRFVQGDAEHLPFPANSFDAVINVEASHCYGNFRGFLDEVARVLRPGGDFLYADFRFAEGGDLEKWDRALEASPLQTNSFREINAEVLRGMERNAVRSRSLIERHLPKFLHSLGRDFAGVPGSRVYNALQQGALSYRAGWFTKPRIRGNRGAEADGRKRVVVS
jgi:SAM-dependent methyltransferase